MRVQEHCNFGTMQQNLLGSECTLFRNKRISDTQNDLYRWNNINVGGLGVWSAGGRIPNLFAINRDVAREAEILTCDNAP
jgi:hypothetical protein